MNFFSDLQVLFIQAVTDSLNLDWSQVIYRRGSFVFKAAAFVAVAFFIALLVKRRKGEPSFYSHSGLVFAKQHKPGVFTRLTRGLAWTFLLASVFFLGVTIADPAIQVVDVVEQTESREIVYLSDISASNGFRMRSTNVSRAEIKKEFTEKLILKRRAKNDRAAYVVFGTHSEIWSAFTTSFESLTFSISRAPVLLAPPEAPRMWPGMFILKQGQFTESSTGGSTNLHLGLQSVIYLFDRKGSKEVSEEMARNPRADMRSVVIITDGAAEVDPEPQFVELRKRRIVPYLVFIDPDREVEKLLYGPNSPKALLPDQLLIMVRRYGGQYFLAHDRQSVDNISDKLDELQSIKQTRSVNVEDEEVYYIPLALAFFFGAAALLTRLVFMRLWRTV